MLKVEKSKDKTTVMRLLEEFILHQENDPILEKVRVNLESKLIDPSIINRFDKLPDNSYLKIEAQTIIDSFESVTNGMQNPEAMDRLKEIEEKSIFFEWKSFILTIFYIYNKQPDKAILALDNIKSHSALFKLVPAFKILINNNFEEEQQSNKNLVTFIRSLFDDNDFLFSIIDQLEESLNEEMVDVFTDTLILIIRELLNNNQELAKQISIWAIRTLTIKECSTTHLIQSIKSVFGDAEGLRLVALSFLEEDPDISILFWIRSLIGRLEEKSIDLKTTNHFLTILNMIGNEVFDIYEEDPEYFDDEYFNGLHNLVSKLCFELSSLYPEEFKEHKNIIKGKELIMFLCEPFEALNYKRDLSKNNQNNSQKDNLNRQKPDLIRPVNHHSKQLELFA
jgi:hypothetical protein